MFEKLKNVGKKSDKEQNSVAKFFNLAYKDIFNSDDINVSHSDEVLGAKDHISLSFESLNDTVWGILAFIKCKYPKSTIEFLDVKDGKSQSLALDCVLNDKGERRKFVFSYDGVIIYDSIIEENNRKIRSSIEGQTDNKPGQMGEQ